jgi:hypothetical protein
MKTPSQNRVGLIAFIAASALVGCGSKPAPTEEESAAALFHQGPPSLVRKCNRLLEECDRLFRPGHRRDDCVRELLHGECGHLPHVDAGRDMVGAGKDAAGDAKGGPRDAAPDVAVGHLDSGVDRHVDSGAADLRSVTIDGSIDFCPIITSFPPLAVTAVVGQPLTLNATAVDPNPGDTLTYIWGPCCAASVSFAPVESATGTTTVTCLAAGTFDIELTVDDGRLTNGNIKCATSQSSEIFCVCPDGGCPLPACLPDGASCDNSVGPACCNGEACSQGVCGGACLTLGTDCDGSIPCCPGVPCTNGVCGGCLIDQRSCSSTVPCCSGGCPLSDKCGGPECRTTGESCDGTVPCCGGPQVIVSCTGGFCSFPMAPPCVPDGEPCTTGSQCCGGMGNPGICFGTCGACVLAGAPCDLGIAGCCNGATCVAGVCVDD